MALIQVNFMSKSLMRTVPVQVLLPVDKTAPLMSDSVQNKPDQEKKTFKTLYLLHGIYGNCTDWICGTNIQRWAEEKDLAVVMPSGDNAFYVDQEAGHNYYGEFIGKELVDITRKMFPLSGNREDTFLAGLSMGGYGALRNGLKYHETFGYIAGLSSALITGGKSDNINEALLFMGGRKYAEAVFGDLNALAAGDKNPAWLAAKLAEEGADIPKIYLTCGTEDPLLEANRAFKAILEKLKIPVTYEEDKGAHNWDFWDEAIRRVLNWLPLDNMSNTGVNSQTACE